MQLYSLPPFSQWLAALRSYEGKKITSPSRGFEV
jgi:hypothetical protein